MRIATAMRGDTLGVATSAGPASESGEERNASDMGAERTRVMTLL